MIFLGNLSIKDMEKRTGIEFPEALKEYMSNRKQDRACNVEPGKWHCYDIPFVLMCGDIETATQIYNQMKPFADSFKESLQIALNPNTESEA